MNYLSFFIEVQTGHVDNFLTGIEIKDNKMIVSIVIVFILLRALDLHVKCLTLVN